MKRSTLVAKITRESIPIPGSNWGLHPAVPVWLIRRDPEAQRPSQKDRLIKKAGEFDLDKIGTPELFPDGEWFNAIVGATRSEWALDDESSKTIPAKIWRGKTLSASERGERFLNELECVKPGTEVAHKIALLASREAAELVSWAHTQLPATREGTLRTFYAILGTRPTGAEQSISEESKQLLFDVIKAINRIKVGGGAKETLPGAVIKATALLVSQGRTISSKWSKSPWELPVARARVLHARNGGKGTVIEHLATILEGRRATK